MRFATSGATSRRRGAGFDENSVQDCPSSGRETPGSDLPMAAESGLCPVMDELVESEITRWLSLLKTDAEIVAALDDLTEDAVRRSALQAQIMSAEIVREVLSGMTDEKLNAIVYEKVEPDLLWIRMNGSIVGAAVGLGLFLLMEAAKRLA